MSDSTSTAPKEDLFAKMKREAAERAAASIAARDAALERAEDGSHDKQDSLRRVIQDPDASAEPFATAAEERAAMADPRYKSSQEYRANVLQRVAAGLRQGNAGTPLRREQPTSERALSSTSRVAARDLNADATVAQVREVYDVQPFRTRAELRDAMRDKRYQRDGSWRAIVAARLDVTNMNRLV